MCDKCGCGAEPTDNAQSLKDRIQNAIEAIRPGLQSHGGDIQLVGVDPDNTVRVKLRGACSGCPGAMMTLKNGVERVLKEQVPQVKQVVAVN